MGNRYVDAPCRDAWYKDITFNVDESLQINNLSRPYGQLANLKIRHLCDSERGIIFYKLSCFRKANLILVIYVFLVTLRLMQCNQMLSVFWMNVYSWINYIWRPGVRDRWCRRTGPIIQFCEKDSVLEWKINRAKANSRLDQSEDAIHLIQCEQSLVVDMSFLSRQGNLLSHLHDLETKSWSMWRINWLSWWIYVIIVGQWSASFYMKGIYQSFQKLKCRIKNSPTDL